MYKCPNNPEHKEFKSNVIETNQGTGYWDAEGDFQDYKHFHGNIEIVGKVTCCDCDVEAINDEF